MTTNRIATLLPAQALRPSRQQFWPGCRVRVDSGPMAGAEGTVLAYCSTSRLIIAVDVSCRGVTLEIDEQKLTPLDE